MDNGTLDILHKELAAAQAEISRLTENQRLQDSATAAVMERAEKAEAELAACREDAERYRWLRKRDSVYPAPSYQEDIASNDQIDRSIDAARKEGA